MRFKTLQLNHFGHFPDLELTFPRKPGLVIVEGPNEAGKSTILQALRGLFFGIHPRSPYAFKFGYPSMEVSADLRLDGGDRLEVHRFKRRKNALTGELRKGSNREPIDEERFQALLGSVDEDRFEALFAFCLEDLMQGADVLQRANLSELIAGGALGRGGSAVLDLLTELEASSNELFRPRARKDPIPRLLTQLKDEKRKLEAAILRHDRYRELRDEMESKEQEQSRVLEKLAEAEQRRAHLERLLQVYGDYWERERLRKQLAVLPEIEIGELERERLSEAMATRREVEAALKQEQKRLQELEQQAAELEVDEAVLPAEESITRAFRELDRFLTAERQLKSLRSSRKEAREQLATANESLDLGEVGLVVSETGLHLGEARLHLLPEHGELLAGWARRWEQLKDKQGHRKAQQRALEAELEGQERILAELRELETDPTLVGLVAEVETQQERWQRLRHQRERLSGMEEQLASARARLQPTWHEDLGATSVHLPSTEELARFEAEARQLDDERTRLEQRRQERRGQLSQIVEELEELLDEGPLPTEDELQAARRRRDRGFELCRRSWLLGEEIDRSDLAPDGDLAAAVREAFEEADRLADRRFEEAQRVARQAALKRTQGQREAALQRLAEQLEENRAQQKAFQQRWRSLWEEIPVEPLAPPAMREWLEEVQELRQRRRRVIELESTVERLEARLAPYQERLRKYLGQPEEELTALFRLLRQRELRSQELKGKLEEAERQVTKLRQQLLENEAQLGSLQEEADQLQGRVGKLLFALGLQPGRDPEAAYALYQKLAALHSQIEDLEGVRRQITEAEQIVEAYQQTVERLRRRFGAGEEDVPTLVEGLFERLGRAREARRALEESAMAREKQQQRIEELEQQQREVGELLDRFQDQHAGEDVMEVLEQAHQRSELEADLQQLDTRLCRQLGSPEAQQAAAEELAESERDELEAELSRLSRRIDDLDEQRSELLTTLGRLEGEQQRLGGGEAATVRATVEEVREQLGRNVEEYVRLRLGHTVLQRTIDRFARENQPTLMVRWSQLLARLTGGRYRKVVNPIGTEDLFVERPNGRRLEPGELSTGTREQLFLALRLAFALEHCQRSESLPLVMDDVLVNFDEDRAGAALETLHRISQEAQVLLFTCHPHLVRQAKRELSGVKVKRLPDLPGVEKATESNEPEPEERPLVASEPGDGQSLLW